MINWDQIVSPIVTAIVPLLIGAIIVLLKIGINWMRQQQNGVLHTIGELAYQEVQSNFAGAAGADKMQLALQKARTRLGHSGMLDKFSDTDIVNAIQKAWFQNEGQYKLIQPSPNVPVSTLGTFAGQPTLNDPGFGMRTGPGTGPGVAIWPGPEPAQNPPASPVELGPNGNFQGPPRAADNPMPASPVPTDPLADSPTPFVTPDLGPKTDPVAPVEAASDADPTGDAK